MVHSTVFISSTLIDVWWTISLSWVTYLCTFHEHLSQFVWQSISSNSYTSSVSKAGIKALRIVLPLFFPVKVCTVKPREHCCQILDFILTYLGFEVNPRHDLVHLSWRTLYPGFFCSGLLEAWVFEVRHSLFDKHRHRCWCNYQSPGCTGILISGLEKWILGSQVMLATPVPGATLAVAPSSHHSTSSSPATSASLSPMAVVWLTVFPLDQRGWEG